MESFARGIRIPTALTRTETLLLQSLSYRKTVVEAGSLLGYSTVAMARVAERVVAVDPHDGYPAGAARSTLAAFLANLQIHGVAARVSPIVGTFETAFPSLSSDLVFLDLTGEYDLTVQAVKAALSVAPLVAVHDFERGGCTGCTAAVDFLVRRAFAAVECRRDTTVVLSRTSTSWLLPSASPSG